jgi:hypothetical protein
MTFSSGHAIYTNELCSTPPLSTDGSDHTSTTISTTDMSVKALGAVFEAAAKRAEQERVSSVDRPRHRRGESRVLKSANTLNELRAKFDTLATASSQATATLEKELENFRSKQEEVKLWLGATTVALSSLESGGLGSEEDLEGTAALQVSVKRFNVQLESLLVLGNTLKRRYRLEYNDEKMAETIERECTELESSWRDLRDRVDAARRIAMEAHERDQEMEKMIHALDVDVTKALSASTTNSSTFHALGERLTALEQRMQDTPPTDEKVREKLSAQLRSIHNTLKGARASASRRYDTFSAVAGQLEGLLTTLRDVSTRCLASLKICEEHYKQGKANAANGMTAEAKRRLAEFQAKRKHYTPAVEKLLQILSNSVIGDNEHETSDDEDRKVMSQYAEVEQAWSQVQEVMWDVETLQQQLEKMENEAKTWIKEHEDEGDETHLYPELSVIAHSPRCASPTEEAPSDRRGSTHSLQTKRTMTPSLLQRPRTSASARANAPSFLIQPGFLSGRATPEVSNFLSPPDATDMPMLRHRPSTSASMRSLSTDVFMSRSQTPTADMGYARAVSPAPAGRAPTLRRQQSSYQLRQVANAASQRSASPLPSSTSHNPAYNQSPLRNTVRPATAMARHVTSPPPSSRSATSLSGRAPTSGPTGRRSSASSSSTVSSVSVRPASSMGKYGRTVSDGPQLPARNKTQPRRGLSPVPGTPRSASSLGYSSPARAPSPLPRANASRDKSASEYTQNGRLAAPNSGNGNAGSRSRPSSSLENRRTLRSVPSMPSISVTSTTQSISARYTPDPTDPLDVRVAAIVNRAPISVPVKKIGNGRYSFGGRIWLCKMDPRGTAGRGREGVSVRIGGGWKGLEVALMECAISD